MRTTRSYLRRLGLALFVVSLMAACDFLSGVDDADADGVDTVPIHQGAAQTEAAFRSGDIEQVKAVMTDEALALYAEAFPEMEERLADYGAAIASRELTVATPFYAEYSFTDAGKTYSVAFARAGENEPWKLARF